VSRRLLASIALAAATVVMAGGGTSRAQVGACPAPSYPGDAAAREPIAQWMAYGAAAAALPRELPVMAALVESGLQNTTFGDADSVGYFQMRMSIWNQGAYAGFPQQPELQLKWFIDQATAVRSSRIAAGGPDPAAAEGDWGAWIADVQRPPEQNRGLYQPRLPDARTLIGAACVLAVAAGGTVPPGAGSAPTPPPADTVAPAVRLGGDARQRAVRHRAIIVAIACPAEACTASAVATLHLPGARRALRITSAARSIAAGRRATLRVPLTGVTRARLRKALRSQRSVAASVRLVVLDAAANRTVRTRTVRITG
jgi:hypothetical protein